MALLGLSTLILKRMQLARPTGEPATISFQMARLSSTGRCLRLDSTPSPRSCTHRQAVQREEEEEEKKKREKRGGK